MLILAVILSSKVKVAKKVNSVLIHRSAENMCMRKSYRKLKQNYSDLSKDQKTNQHKGTRKTTQWTRINTIGMLPYLHNQDCDLGEWNDSWFMPH